MKTFTQRIESDNGKAMNTQLLKIAGFLVILLLINLSTWCTSLVAFSDNQDGLQLLPDDYQNLKVYSLTGKEIRSIQVPIEEEKTWEETFEDLTTGFYLVEVSTNDEDSIVKSLVID